MSWSRMKEGMSSGTFTTKSNFQKGKKSLEIQNMNPRTDVHDLNKITGNTQLTVNNCVLRKKYIFYYSRSILFYLI